MPIREYWLIIGKRWGLILLVALAAAAGAYAYSQLQRPIYRSTVKLLVTPARPDAGQTIAVQNLLRQYNVQVGSERLAQKVSERLKLDLKPEDLQAKVRTSAVPEDLVIAIQVDDFDPQRARDIAYALADEFEQQQWVRMAAVDPRDRIEVVVSSPPQEGKLSWPQTKTNTLAGGLLGLLIGGALAFILEYLDDTLKTAEDVERYTHLTVLGAIPPRQAGAAKGS